jgi:hypothetical protein
MPWKDFVKMRKIRNPQGITFEESGHQLEITGSETHPVVACRTPGCIAVYHDGSFADETLAGTLCAEGTEYDFEIAYVPTDDNIQCTISHRHSGSTTGSWIADDRGPDEPPHRRP